MDGEKDKHMDNREHQTGMDTGAKCCIKLYSLVLYLCYIAYSIFWRIVSFVNYYICPNLFHLPRERDRRTEWLSRTKQFIFLKRAPFYHYNKSEHEEDEGKCNICLNC